MEKGRDRAIHHEFGSFVRCTGIWEGLKKSSLPRKIQGKKQKQENIYLEIKG